jgi:hypothetical protein
MTEQTVLKEIAREYYNAIYGAKLNFSSLDICEKLPSIISFLSMSLGVLGLSFEVFNNKTLASALLIAGIIGLMLKPRSFSKEQYITSGKALTGISKKLEVLHGKAVEFPDDSQNHRTELAALQVEHEAVDIPAHVFLSSWYAHYKVFSEQNNKWFCEELNLTFWKDKLPLSLRLTFIAGLLGFVIYLNPYSLINKSWSALPPICSSECPIEDKQPKSKLNT